MPTVWIRCKNPTFKHAAVKISYYPNYLYIRSPFDSPMIDYYSEMIWYILIIGDMTNRMFKMKIYSNLVLTLSWS